jgi:hypothetical protein
MASSVAAACSSKLKVRQKRLRSARPQARLTRLPNGAWRTRCMSPASSKKRSRSSVSWVGSAEGGGRRRGSRRAGAGGGVDADVGGEPGDGGLAALARRRCWSRPGTGDALAARPRDLPAHRAADSSSLRPGASPSQKGIVGGSPAASSTRTRPCSILRMRHEALPSWKTSPGQALDGEVLVDRAEDDAGRLEHDVVVGGVGMAPPEVSAASGRRAAPRRRPWTASRWR